MAETIARLLVVDDDENNRDMLSRRLQRRGFDVETACDGPNALDIVGKSHFDLILLDIEMPGMNGFEVLKIVRRTHPPTRLPVIIATARGDREDVVEALGLGANDYVTKPLDFPIVAARVDTQLSHKRAMDRIVGLEADLRRQNQELAAANAKMRSSLESASAVQKSLLPEFPVQAPGLKFQGIFNPCDELGGDIMNVFKLGSRHMGMYLLDVSGHGVPAALLSVTLSRMLTPSPDQSTLVEKRSEKGFEPRRPTEVIAELNRRFPMENSRQYFTIFYGLLDLETRRLCYVSAGHPPALLVPSSGDARFIESPGFAIGWFADAEAVERSIDFKSGDRFYVYSDGITEARCKGPDLFGEERLKEVCGNREESMDEILSRIGVAIDDFRGSCAIADDISALAMEVGN